MMILMKNAANTIMMRLVRIHVASACLPLEDLQMWLDSYANLLFGRIIEQGGDIKRGNYVWRY